MVDTASKVNVERALQRQVWSADQFNAVLGQFTDQVCKFICLYLLSEYKIKSLNKKGY